MFKKDSPEKRIVRNNFITLPILRLFKVYLSSGDHDPPPPPPKAESDFNIITLIDNLTFLIVKQINIRPLVSTVA